MEHMAELQARIDLYDDLSLILMVVAYVALAISMFLGLRAR